MEENVYEDGPVQRSSTRSPPSRAVSRILLESFLEREPGTMVVKMSANVMTWLLDSLLGFHVNQKAFLFFDRTIWACLMCKGCKSCKCRHSIRGQSFHVNDQLI